MRGEEGLLNLTWRQGWLVLSSLSSNSSVSELGAGACCQSTLKMKIAWGSAVLCSEILSGPELARKRRLDRAFPALVLSVGWSSLRLGRLYFAQRAAHSRVQEMFVELNYPSQEIFKKTVFSCHKTSLDDTPQGGENSNYYFKIMSRSSGIGSCSLFQL